MPTISRVLGPHRPRLEGLWRHPDFRKFWAGRTVSMFGSQITTIALPLVAVVTLGASPAEMATLYAAGYTPPILVGLLAGVWVDRLRRRPLMVLSDVGRAALLALVPLAGVLGLLRIELLLAVAFLVGVLGVLGDAADNAYLPSLVGREHLVEANAKLEASSSVARIAGPGIGGLLVQLLSAPVAVAMDAVSFLASALSLGLIRKAEPPPPPPHERRPLRIEIVEGLRSLLGNPVLRAFLASSVTFDLAWNALFALYFVYVTRELGLPAGAYGLIFGVGSVGSMVGALLAGPVARRLGVGPVCIASQLAVGLGSLPIALAAAIPDAALPLLVGAEFAQSCADTIYSINRNSLTQTVTPDRVLGRVYASRSFVGLGVVPLAAFLGVALSARIGVTGTVVVGACAGLPSFLWLLFSPVRTLRRMPGAAPPQDEPTNG
ncbi:MAG: MFS transporter [Chloroflexota bacterium]|nr:MFS transporter [Chloroflexota bacterium]